MPDRYATLAKKIAEAYMKTIAVDGDIVVSRAPGFREAVFIINRFLREAGKPFYSAEIEAFFSGYMGGRLVRRALNHLLALGIIVEYVDGTIGYPVEGGRFRETPSRKRYIRVVDERKDKKRVVRGWVA